MIVTKYITRHVLWINLFTLYVIHYNGIIQKPHDHLFQKSEASGFNSSALTMNKQKSTNLSVFSL